MGEIKYYDGKISPDAVISPCATIHAKTLIIEDNVHLDENVYLRGDYIHLKKNVRILRGVEIRSRSIEIGENTTVDENAKIIAFERFSIGRYSIIRRNAQFKARTIEIGEFFYSDDNPIPLIIGGGGSDRPTAHIKIGNRCVMHDSFINVCMPVEIGDNVGMSPGSAIITHGFWNPVIEGFWAEFAGVKLGRNVIVGYRALILPGVTIGDYCTIGAGAVVTKSFPSYSIIGGVPAKLIKTRPEYPKELDDTKKKEILFNLLEEYAELLTDKIDAVRLTKNEKYIIIDGEFNRKQFVICFSMQPAEIPLLREDVRRIFIHFGKREIRSGDFLIDLTDYSFAGVDDEISSDLRDFLRHYGIRIFSGFFRSIPPKLKRALYS
ncbi:MAG: DapH/DapD/GlmU-related protein [Thermoplasmata archaeon]